MDQEIQTIDQFRLALSPPPEIPSPSKKAPVITGVVCALWGMFAVTVVGGGSTALLVGITHLPAAWSITPVATLMVTHLSFGTVWIVPLCASLAAGAVVVVLSAAAVALVAMKDNEKYRQICQAPEKAQQAILESMRRLNGTIGRDDRSEVSFAPSTSKRMMFSYLHPTTKTQCNAVSFYAQLSARGAANGALWQELGEVMVTATICGTDLQVRVSQFQTGKLAEASVQLANDASWQNCRKKIFAQFFPEGLIAQTPVSKPTDRATSEPLVRKKLNFDTPSPKGGGRSLPPSPLKHNWTIDDWE